MNQPIKILFDENFGEPLVSALAAVLDWYEEPVEICHLFKFAKPSEKDEVWVPRIATGGWTVVSTDKGKRCGGKKLSQVCCDHRVTHILVSTALHKAKHFEKLRAVVAAWPRIVLATRWEQGSRYSLRYDGPEKRIVLTESLPKAALRASGTTPALGFDGKRRKVTRTGRRQRAVEIPAFERLFPSPGNGSSSTAREDRI